MTEGLSRITGRSVICLLAAGWLALQPLAGQLRPIAKAQEADSPAVGQEDEEEDIDETALPAIADQLATESVVDDWLAIEWLNQPRPNLLISPQDKNRLTDYGIDVRVTDYLYNLAAPEELGGEGFDHLKITRLKKHYDSEGYGRFDREVAAQGEEQSARPSASA